MTNARSDESPPFTLVSIDPAAAPAGASGKQWCRYVIAQGDNVIDGLRRGSLAAVTEAVERNLIQLNERRGGKRGYSYPMSVPRSKPT
jgi:hypothetical protein